MTTKVKKTISIVAKILEVASFAFAVAYLVLLILLVLKTPSVASMLASIASENHGELIVNGFSIAALEDGDVIYMAQITFAIAGILSFACYMMIFRNVYLILKTVAKETGVSRGETSFRKDVFRMVLEIGIFYMLIPFFSFILSIIFNAIIGSDVISVTNLGEIVAGLIIILLGNIFYNTEKLEKKQN